MTDDDGWAFSKVGPDYHSGAAGLTQDDDDFGVSAGSAVTSADYGSVSAQDDAVGAPIGPPFPFLWAAVACIAAAGGLVVLARARPAVAVIGWLLAGPVGIGVLTAFTIADARRRANPWYLPSRAAAILRTALVAVAAGVVAAHAWYFADWVSR